MALFCVHTVELDTHGDIRGKYLPQLLRAVLSGMGRQGVNNMKSQIVLGLIELAHCILLEINQSAAAVEAGSSFCLAFLVFILLRSRIICCFDHENCHSFPAAFLSRKIKSGAVVFYFWKTKNFIADLKIPFSTEQGNRLVSFYHMPRLCK